MYLRRQPEAHAASIYPLPGATFMPWVVLAFFAFIIVALTQDPDTAIALAVTPIWFVVLFFMWRRVRGRVVLDGLDDEDEDNETYSVEAGAQA